MPEQDLIATSQRRNLILEGVRRLSKTRSWVTQRDILANLRGQGYDVQKHQVLRDLKALVQIHPELECYATSDEDGVPRRGLEYGYRWVARDAPPETGLSIPEALSLVMVARHLKQALPATLSGALQKLFERAEATLNLQQKNGVAHWQDMVGVVPPTQPMLPPRIHDEVIQVIHQALIAKEQFRGVYRSASGDEEERLLHPLGIMVREPSIYLIAVADGYDDPRIYALHRFITAQREHLPISPLEGFSLPAFLEEQGNFGTGKWLTLKAAVCEHLGRILEETPLGHGQLLGEPDEDGWRPLQVKVRDNWQLKWWLLAQADRIWIKGPRQLRERIYERACSVVEMYESGTE